MSGISSDYATLYDYCPAQGVVHWKNCPKIFKFHPQKTGYTTIKEHYATTYPEEIRQFNLRRNQAESVPSVAKSFKSDKKCEKMSKNQKLALSFCVSAHPLPFNFYEDDAVKWATRIECSAKTLKNEI